jgi:hypothetical protein
VILLIVRPDRVLAGTAFLLWLALVAVPGSVGSQAPSLFPTVSTQDLRAVVVDDGLAGSATLHPDPALRSAQTVTSGDILTEPAPSAAARARPAGGQLTVPAGTIVRNVWRYDPEASFYGPGFYGQRTACGVALTTTVMGVAHRTLPCGTLITFRNPENGRTATVPVIDRGPYVAGRIWDLTGGLCAYLRHCYTGPILWRYASPH